MIDFTQSANAARDAEFQMLIKSIAQGDTFDDAFEHFKRGMAIIELAEQAANKLTAGFYSR